MSVNIGKSYGLLGNKNHKTNYIFLTVILKICRGRDKVEFVRITPELSEEKHNFMLPFRKMNVFHDIYYNLSAEQNV